jgi:DNA-binding MarR family transcriptional regulator
MKKENYSDQITTIVHGFIDQWIKFEARLHAELAKTHPLAETGMGGDNHSNYSFFFRLSSIIASRKQITMGELSNTLSVPFSNATRMVNWLVENEYAKRLADPSDRRVVLVELTEKGKELHRVIDDYTRKNVQQIIGSGLNSEEKLILITLINKVMAALKNLP